MPPKGHAPGARVAPPETAISNGKCREIVPIKSRIFCLIIRGIRFFHFLTEMPVEQVFRSKTAVFSLKSLSFTLPRAVTIYPQTTPFFGRTQITIPFSVKTASPCPQNRQYYHLSKGGRKKLSCHFSWSNKKSEEKAPAGAAGGDLKPDPGDRWQGWIAAKRPPIASQS